MCMISANDVVISCQNVEFLCHARYFLRCQLSLQKWLVLVSERASFMNSKVCVLYSHFASTALSLPVCMYSQYPFFQDLIYPQAKLLTHMTGPAFDFSFTHVAAVVLNITNLYRQCQLQLPTSLIVT